MLEISFKYCTPVGVLMKQMTSYEVSELVAYSMLKEREKEREKTPANSPEEMKDILAGFGKSMRKTERETK